MSWSDWGGTAKAGKKPPGPRSVEWAVEARPKPGERVGGDVAVVDPSRGLLVVIDALGHGEGAHRAARIAEEAVRSTKGDSLPELVQTCHVSLRASRGAAMSAARISLSPPSLYWAGVGDVQTAIIQRARYAVGGPETLSPAPGLVGHALPELREVRRTISRGDVLILATDGIDARFMQEELVTGSADSLTRRILRDFGRPGDDALVLVARYLGDGG